MPRTPNQQPGKFTRRRKLVLAFSFVALIAIGGIAYQAWQIVEAIVQAERVAVVPWSTREPSQAVAAATTTTPTALTESIAASPTATVTPRSTETKTAINAPRVAVTSTTATEPLPSETATTETTVKTPELSVTPTPQLGQSSTGSTHLSVVRDILGAGTDDGDPGKSEVWGGRTSLNILVVGVDRRPDGGDQNADVLIIAHVDLINKRVSAVSLPRDLLVEIPGVGPDKINGSYNYGVKDHPDDLAAGVTKVRDTIESVFGVSLDGYVLIDFNGFTDVVDSVDGVDINVPYDIVDDEYPTEDYGTEVVKFDKGLQHMDGDTALKYVRTRHADSDDARRERQYQVLLALFDTGKRFSSVTRADNLILALGKSVQTSFPLDQQLTLARVGMEIDRSDIRLSVLGPPLLQQGYTADGKWIYYGDPTQLTAFVQDALITDPGLIPNASPAAIAP
jgi:LCP family protein required for cell wall assembly